jgi:hypothetical protein
MDVTVHIPDDLASRVTGGDLSRRALEAHVADAYRQDQARDWRRCIEWVKTYQFRDHLPVGSGL